MALRPLDFPEVCNAWVGQAPRERSFFTPDLVGVLQPLRQQEAVGGDAESGVVMKAAPATALVLSQPQVLLEILVVALDSPAHLGLVDHALQRRVLGQRGQPVLQRAKCERSAAFVPSRQVTSCQSSGSMSKATSLTVRGRCSGALASPRRSRRGMGPLPL